MSRIDKYTNIWSVPFKISKLTPTKNFQNFLFILLPLSISAVPGRPPCISIYMTWKILYRKKTRMSSQHFDTICYKYLVDNIPNLLIRLITLVLTSFPFHKYYHSLWSVLNLCEVKLCKNHRLVSFFEYLLFYLLVKIQALFHTAKLSLNHPQ